MNTGLRLGIDIGGTSIKAGVVDGQGQIIDRLTHTSQGLGTSGDPIADLSAWIIEPLCTKHAISGIGIGVPGVLSKDRSTPLEVVNLRVLEGHNLREGLQARHPGCKVRIENDANAAAVGAHIFDTSIPEDTFGFITIGTGIGSAALVDGKLFTGGSGNGLELGLFPSWGGRILEDNIGRIGLGERAARHAHGTNSVLAEDPCPSPKFILEAADAGDAMAQKTLAEAGTMLAEALVSFIVVMDITTIYIGGGISPCFSRMLPSLQQYLEKYLVPYYTRTLAIRRAELGNDAGILGAAALCIDDDHLYLQ